MPPLALVPGAPRPSRWLSPRPSPVSWTGGPGLETVLQHRPRSSWAGGGVASRTATGSRPRRPASSRSSGPGRPPSGSPAGQLRKRPAASFTCSSQLLQLLYVCVAKADLNATYRRCIFGWSERWRECWLPRGNVSLSDLGSTFYLTEKTEKVRKIFRWLILFLQGFALTSLLDIMVTSSPPESMCPHVFLTSLDPAFWGKLRLLLSYKAQSKAIEINGLLFWIRSGMLIAVTIPDYLILQIQTASGPKKL